MPLDVLEKILPKQTSNDVKPIGLLAGGGELPREIIDACTKNNQNIFVIAFDGEADEVSINHADHIWASIGQVGKWIKKLKKEGIKEILLAGKIKRPNLSELKVDFTGARLLSRLLANKRQGDNALFLAIIHFLEQSGLTILGIDQAFPQLLADFGILTKEKPDSRAIDDVQIGVSATKLLGQADIGQSVVVQRGVVLGVEAIEGTDALIRRAGDLSDRSSKGSVLVKMKKPDQDTRIDLPTIGVATIENAHKNGIRGLALEHNGVIIVNKEAVIARANQLDIFIIGINTDGQFK